MARFGGMVVICLIMMLAAIYFFDGIADAAVDNTEVIVNVLVLQNDLPVTHTEIMFAKSIAGRVDSAQWMGMTDAAGRAAIRIIPGSGYYLVRAVDSTGTEIGRWHSIPLNGGMEASLVLRVGKRFELGNSGNEPGITIPKAPAILIMTDYEGGEPGRYLKAVWPHSSDRDVLSNYRLYREMPDDVGGIVQLTFVPWTAIALPSDGQDSMRVVIPVQDTLITRWAVAAEKIGPNGVISSTLTVAISPVRPIDTVPPAPVTDLRGDDFISLSWAPSVDDVAIDTIMFRGQVFPIVGVRAYEVYRRTGSEDWVFLGQLPRGTTMYTDPNPPPWKSPFGYSVSYRIDALDFDNRTPSEVMTLRILTKPAYSNIDSFRNAFGTRQGDANYSNKADANSDGVVDFADFLLFVQGSAF